jgi:hypothetical protein
MPDVAETEVPMSEFEEPAFDYAPPVAELLEVGEEGVKWGDSFDYVEDFELSVKDVPELLRMAADERLSTADSESDLVWAPIHAVRALGQLGAAEAVNPLLNLIVRSREDETDAGDDWLHTAVSRELVEIGAPAASSVARLIVDQGKDRLSRVTAAAVLSKLGRQDLALYPQCVASLATALANFRDNGPELNAVVIGSLIDLDAEETCPLIEQAFADGAVEESIVGDWEDARVELGQLPPLSELAKTEKLYARFPAAREFATLMDRLREQLPLNTELARSSSFKVSELHDDGILLEQLPTPEAQSRMTMPEDVYTADERRRIAKQRNKQRKAVQQAKRRGGQSQHRR